MKKTPNKSGLHPRNRHRDGYDFDSLLVKSPGLAAHLTTNPAGRKTIDFHDPKAVKMLNKALLLTHYKVTTWELPDGYLCPAVPGRADYLHHLADLLAADHQGRIPKGPKLQLLDIGVGANCIYPILGNASYGWSFVGSDTNQAALAVAQQHLAANPHLAKAVALRHQSRATAILDQLIQPGDYFDATLCNPPFYSSAAEVKAEWARKQRGLRKKGSAPRNFSGAAAELWCPGGERAFVKQLITESQRFGKQVCWFTTLVSREKHLPKLRATLQTVGAIDTRLLEMSTGQKQSRLLAWTFLSDKQRKIWQQTRWK